jgi:hypothetical protein
MLLISTFISSSFIFIFQTDETKIYWQTDRKLTWNDFQGQAPANTSLSAISTVSMGPGYVFKDYVLDIDTRSYFQTSTSWSKQKDQDEGLLKHEQGHFDIGEIYARKFRKEIIATDLNIKNLQTKLEKITRKLNEEFANYQVLYDKETKHHINTEKQEEWNIRLAKELKELDAYTETHITMQIK